MTVKEKVGRKRYILVEMDNKVSKAKMKKIIGTLLNGTTGKIEWRLMNMKGKTMIVRVDHRIASSVRKELNGVIEGVEFKSLKTSGTMRSLKNKQKEID